MTKNNVIITAVVVVLVAIGGIYLYNQSAQNTPTSPSYNTNTQSNSAVKGRMVAGITDAANSLGNVTSIQITVDKVELHSATSDWITVSTATKVYDLVALKQSDKVALLVDTTVPVGTYDQARLNVSKVIVVANGQTQTAKLPFKSLKIVGNIIVDTTGTSTIMFDFLADKSLHETGSGKIIFTPVVKFNSEADAGVETSENDVRVKNHGKAEADETVGMDENGDVKANFEFDNSDKFDIEGDSEDNAIRVILPGESTTSTKVSASAAIDAVINRGYLDTALSVKLTTYQENTAWKISGIKGSSFITVYVDATTAAVITTVQKSED